jgi:uncharacterized membrane protein
VAQKGTPLSAASGPEPDTQMSDQMEKNIIRLGRVLYALGMIGLGGQHFYNADFIPVIVPSAPAWMYGQYFWTSLVGAGLIIMGLAIAIGTGARAAGILLGALLVAALAFVDIPHQLVTSVGPVAAWNNCFKALTLAGGAFVVAASIPAPASQRWDRGFVSFGCAALAITVAVFGAEHFQYVAFVADLIPRKIPGHVFWTYFCGAALIAAGAGMILRIKARLAAGLLGAMILAWVPLLHIPRALADPHSGNGNEWSSVFEATSFAGIGIMLSRLLPRTPTQPAGS